MRMNRAVFINLRPKIFKLSGIELEKLGRLFYGFGKFVHIHSMFGFRAVSRATYAGDGSTIFAGKFVSASV